MISFLKNAVFIFLSSVLFLQSLVSSGIAQPKSEPITLRVPIPPTMGSTQFFIAEEEGFFAEQGLQIQYMDIIRSTDALPALVQGKLDVLHGVMSVGFLNAMARGGKIKFVADKGYLPSTGCAYNALLARRAFAEAGERGTPIQMKGRRIAINPVSIEAYYVEKFLSTVGLTLNDTTIVDIPTAIIPEALEKGTIDFAATTEPWVTRVLEAKQGVIWTSINQVIPDFQFALLLYGPTLLEKNPEAGKRLMIAYLKAVRQYNQGKTERNLKMITKRTRLEEEFLKKVCWSPHRNSGEINIRSVLDFQAWGAKKGFIEKEVSPDQFWDPRFIEYANKVLSGSAK